jgi:hypothetical protein
MEKQSFDKEQLTLFRIELAMVIAWLICLLVEFFDVNWEIADDTANMELTIGLTFTV